MKYSLPLILLLTMAACGKKAQVTSSQSADATYNVRAEQNNDQLLASAVKGNDPRTVESLLRKSAEPNQLLSDGSSLLNYSIINNYVSVAEALLVGGASTEKMDKNTDIPLLLALKSKNPILVRLLVVYGANINRVDSKFRTPLMLSIMNQDEELSEWLMDRGADLSLLDSRQRDAAQYAQEYALTNLFTLIHIRQELNKGVTTDTLLAAMMKENDVRGIRELLNRNSTVLHTLTTPSAMTLAVQMSDEAKALEITQLYLDYEMSVQGSGEENSTPLIKASSLGRLQIIDLLLTRGADVLRVDESGKSALIQAVLNYKPDAVKMLLDAKAPKEYQTPGVSGTIKQNACDYARQARDKATDKTQKDLSEKTMQHLGCGLRWLIFW